MADSPVASPLAALLSLTSHELRTPASVAAGYLRMLRQNSNPPLAAQQLRLIDEAERSIARMAALIAEMSELAAIETGTAAVHPQSFDLFATARSVAGEVRESADGRVQLQVRGLAEGAPMFGDLARLKVAFAAVFQTALREQTSPGLVIVDSRRIEEGAGTSAVVVVAPESSVGTAHTTPRASFNELRGGLGLALPIARRVIESHGGTLWSPALTGSADGTLRGAVVISMPISV